MLDSQNATIEQVFSKKDDFNQFKSFLKEHKFDFDETNEEGKTLLMLLIEAECPSEFIWFTLEYFSDPNIQDSKGNTGLHYAFTKGNRNIIYCLLLFNADLDIKNLEETDSEDEKGRTPVEKNLSLFKDRDIEQIKEIIDPELKRVFAMLTRSRRDALREIYNFLDDLRSGIPEDKLIQFNVWLNNDTHDEAREDAKAFMHAARLPCNGGVSEIFYEEWMVALTRIALEHGLGKVDAFLKLFSEVKSSNKKFEEF